MILNWQLFFLSQTDSFDWLIDYCLTSSDQYFNYIFRKRTCSILSHTLSYTSFVLRFQKEHNLRWEPLKTLEYTTTHRFLKKSIWSNEHTMTYSPLQNVNLVKWAYDDLQVSLKCQSGQMSIRWPTGHFKMSIWSNEHTTTYRCP